MTKIVKRVVRGAVDRTLAFYRRAIGSSLRRRSLRLSRGLDSIDRKRSVFVFFAPEAGIVSHFAAHCILARTLRDLGHQVLIVRCFNVYHHCPYLEMSQLPLTRSLQQREDACTVCAQSGLAMTLQYDLPTIQLSDLLTPQMRAKVKALARSMPADVAEFEVNGVRFGALCASDLAVNTKKINQLTATGGDRELLEAYVEASLTSYRATQVLLRRFNIGRLVFFNEYSILMGAVAAAKSAGVPVLRISYAIHCNIDRRKIIMMSDPLAIINYHRCLDDWGRWRDLALPPGTIKMVSDNQLARFGASGFTVYSPKFTAGASDIFEQLCLAPDRRVLVAYTSSLDEYFSNINLMASVGTDLFQKEQPFVDQIAWLTALIAYVESSEHLQLVVRIHPREGKNARESVASEHLDLLRAHFVKDYAHVRMIWPEDPTSSYDLAEIADLALTSWTNITLEAVRLGVPTIVAFKRVNPFPIDDVVEWASTPCGYFELVERRLAMAPSFDAVRYAYRWSHCAYLASYVDVGDVVPAADFVGLPTFRSPSAAGLIEKVMLDGVSLQEIKHSELAGLQSPAVAAAEAEALRRELRRLIWFLATGEDRPTDYSLAFGTGMDLANSDVVVSLDGNFVVVRSGARTVRRRSRGIERLARLACQTAQADARVAPL